MVLPSIFVNYSMLIFDSCGEVNCMNAFAHDLLLIIYVLLLFYSQILL